MTREPWQKAHDLNKLKDAGLSTEEPLRRGKGPGAPLRQKPRVGLAILIALLVLIVGGGAAAWFTRDLWYPRLKRSEDNAAAEFVTRAIPEPELELDWLFVEDGLGVNLVVFGDYLELVGATNEYMTDWELKQTSEDSLRLTAEGVKIYVRNGLIQTYELDFTRIFTHDDWGPWQSELRRAGLSPDTNWSAVTDDEQAPDAHMVMERTGESRQVQGGWVRPRWVLHFRGGWLSQLESEIAIGVADEAEATAPDVLPPRGDG